MRAAALGRAAVLRLVHPAAACSPRQTSLSKRRCEPLAWAGGARIRGGAAAAGEGAESAELEAADEDGEEDDGAVFMHVETPRGRKELLRQGPVIVERHLADLLAQAESSRISASEYVSSAVDMGGCPAPKFPEFAFIGRSNVGKSSLINCLTGRKALAMVSKTPGADPGKPPRHQTLYTTHALHCYS